MIKVSDISQKIQPSLTRALFNMAKEYDDVIDFTLGDPDIQPHQDIKDAGCMAIQAGKTRYSQNAGLLELRETISVYYKEQEGFLYNPLNEIIATVGAMEGLYLALLSILNPGDEVIIPAPYYVNYVQMVQMCHAVPVIVESSDEYLSFSIEDVRKAISPKTRAIIINTPSNPSGRIIPWEKIEALADIAKENDLVVLSDEVYKCLIYDNREFRSIVSIDGMRERTILINSLSKEYCMTGYRMGYVMAPAEVIATMTKLQENIVACAPLPSQYAAIQALKGNKEYSKNMVSIFTERRDILVEGISGMPLLKCTAPEATFYLMTDISQTGMKSLEFATELLKYSHVAVVPGVSYGKACDSFVRIAFTLDIEKIKEGIKRIESFIKHLEAGI